MGGGATGAETVIEADPDFVTPFKLHNDDTVAVPAEMPFTWTELPVADDRETTPDDAVHVHVAPLIGTPLASSAAAMACVDWPVVIVGELRVTVTEVRTGVAGADAWTVTIALPVTPSALAMTCGVPMVTPVT